MATLSSLIAATLLLATPQASKAHTDFSAIDALWPIIHSLKKDVSPTEAEWKKVFETPAYKYLRRESFVKDFLELTFMPSKKDERERRSKPGDQAREIFKHFQRFADNEDAIRKMGKDFSTRDLVDEALHLTKEFLPASIDYPSRDLRFVSHSSASMATQARRSSSSTSYTSR